MLTEQTVNQFLDELASSSPAPGGGSVAALAASLGVALTSMVCRLTIGKKKYLDVEEEMRSVLHQADELRSKATALIEEDTYAFNTVMNAFAMPKETEEQQKDRSEAIQEATKSATLAPLKVIRLSLEALKLDRVVAEKGNRNSISDAGVAALMLQAASAGAAMNVKINLSTLRDEEFVKKITDQMTDIAGHVESSSHEILRMVEEALR